MRAMSVGLWPKVRLIMTPKLSLNGRGNVQNRNVNLSQQWETMYSRKLNKT